MVTSVSALHRSLVGRIPTWISSLCPVQSPRLRNFNLFLNYVWQAEGPLWPWDEGVTRELWFLVWAHLFPSKVCTFLYGIVTSWICQSSELALTCSSAFTFLPALVGAPAAKTTQSIPQSSRVWCWVTSANSVGTKMVHTALCAHRFQPKVENELCLPWLSVGWLSHCHP